MCRLVIAAGWLVSLHLIAALVAFADAVVVAVVAVPGVGTEPPAVVSAGQSLRYAGSVPPRPPVRLVAMPRVDGRLVARPLVRGHPAVPSVHPGGGHGHGTGRCVLGIRRRGGVGRSAVGVVSVVYVCMRVCIDIISELEERS